MTLADITARISFLTGQTTTAYAAADRLISLNKWYNKIHTMILQSQDEWDFDDSNKTDFQILYTDIVANQQDYALPSEILKIKRVEVTYDGSTWSVVTPMDIGEYGKDSTVTTTSGMFNASSPYYDVMGSSVLLYPIPATSVSDGLKVWIDRSVTEFTSADVTAGTAQPGFDVNFHDMLPLGVAYDWFVGPGKDLQKSSAIISELSDYEARLRKHYSGKQKDRKYNLTPLIEDYS
jgi:hypothetical protein